MVALALLGTLATMVTAWSLSIFISRVFVNHDSMASVSQNLRLVAVGGLTKALILWLQELLATRAASSVKLELRQKLFIAANHLGPAWLAKRSVAEINLLATTGLDALEPYFAKYLPQLVYTSLVTPIFLVVIWSQDVLSGITLLVTLPLIPLFMILIGWATRAVQQRQLDSLTLLSQHFLEVLRGLTTLKVFRRDAKQVDTMAEVSKQYRERTMKVLRVSFLSGFTLELIASLSVALIAVSIGLRLMNGELSLMIGLFVLLLAPEAFLPLRQVGAQFHASAEGVAASKGVLDIIDLSQTAHPVPLAKSGWLEKFGDGQLTVLTGPSGIGKSNIFAALLGTSGNSPEIAWDDVAWMPQNSRLFAGSVLENIVGPKVVADSALVDRAMSLAALDDLQIEHVVGAEGYGLSGGQAQRICLARAIYRLLMSNCQYLLLDEPISALDEKRAAQVVLSLQDFANQGKTVVAISHQRSLIAAATKVLEVGNV